MGTIDEFRREYERVGIGVALEELLGKIVWSTVRQYPASEYSPYRTWDQMACEDVLNDWIAERLWGRGDLQAMLSSGATVPQFRAALTTSLRQHLTNKRRKSIASNLYKRARKIMQSDSAFRPVASATAGPNQRWTLAERELADPSPLSMRELLGVANELGDDDLEVVRYGPFSQKLSPILREPKLREFLLHLLSNARGSLSLSSILDVMRSRFSLPVEEQTELDESLSDSRSDPADLAAISAGARTVVLRLDAQEARILEAYFRAGGKLGEAAQSCGAPVDQVRQVVTYALEMIRDCSDSLTDAQAIMQAVEALLLERGN